MNNHHRQHIESLLKKYPGLRSHLERICTGLNRRGATTGVLKLGDRLDRIREVEPLRLMFGERVIVESRAGTATLNFDRFTAASDIATVDDFWATLYAVVGIPRENLPDRRQNADQETEAILARLRLQFPTHAPIHVELIRRRNYWRQQVAKSGAPAIQGLLEQACRVVDYLESNRKTPVTVSDLGARLFNDSKALRSGELPTLVGNFIALLDDPEGAPDVVARIEAWRRRNVVTNPSAIKVTLFGPLRYWKGGREFDWIYRLWECGETATLSWSNVVGIERCELRTDVGSPTPTLITCENETPFCHLVRQRQPGILIYTEGYPNAAVLELLWLLRPLHLPAQHWGDSDLDGLRIADILNRIYPLTLWRCDLPELQRHQACLKPLTLTAKETAANFLHNHPDFYFAAELSHTIQYGWLEQESWH